LSIYLSRWPPRTDYRKKKRRLQKLCPQEGKKKGVPGPLSFGKAEKKGGKIRNVMNTSNGHRPEKKRKKGRLAGRQEIPRFSRDRERGKKERGEGRARLCLRAHMGGKRRKKGPPCGQPQKKRTGGGKSPPINTTLVRGKEKRQFADRQRRRGKGERRPWPLFQN